jgi:hypothetical protein
MINEEIWLMVTDGGTEKKMRKATIAVPEWFGHCKTKRTSCLADVGMDIPEMEEPDAESAEGAAQV